MTLGRHDARANQKFIDLTSAERPISSGREAGMARRVRAGPPIDAGQTSSRIGGSSAASEFGSGVRTLRIEKYAIGAPTATRTAATISENW